MAPRHQLYPHVHRPWRSGTSSRASRWLSLFISPREHEGNDDREEYELDSGAYFVDEPILAFLDGVAHCNQIMGIRCREFVCLDCVESATSGVRYFRGNSSIIEASTGRVLDRSFLGAWVAASESVKEYSDQAHKGIQKPGSTLETDVGVELRAGRWQKDGN